jgi:hypothetical protein
MRVVSAFATATLALASLPTVLGSLFVITPSPKTGCHGGQPCSVQWLDDGQQPLLTTMGPCYVGLFTGKQQLLQQIEPVDVSTTHSLTFTPSPNAGPNSNTYYIAFTSISSPNPSQPLRAFSDSFSLDGMSGSFNSPVPALTSSIPVPSSVLTAQLKSGTTPTPASTVPSSSPSSTSPTASSSPTAIASSSSHSNGAGRQSLPAWVITLVGLSISLFV